MEYIRAAEYAHIPHALVRAEVDELGPAALCPACAGTPDPAGDWQPLHNKANIELCCTCISTVCCVTIWPTLCCHTFAGAAALATGMLTPVPSAAHLFADGE
jgi:hypothetical protein